MPLGHRDVLRTHSITGRLRCDRTSECVDLGRDLRCADARLWSRHHCQPRRIGAGIGCELQCRQRIKRQPDVRFVDTPGPGVVVADHAKYLGDLSVDHRANGGEVLTCVPTGLPVPLADHHRYSVRGDIGVGQRPPGTHRCPHDRKIVGGHDQRPNLFRTSLTLRGEGEPALSDHRIQRGRRSANGVVGLPTYVGVRIAAVGDEDPAERLCIRDCERPEHQGVDAREGDRVDTQPQGQREHHEHCVAGTTEDAAQGVAEVGKHRV